MDGPEFRRRMSGGRREQADVLAELLPAIRRRVRQSVSKAGLGADHVDDILQDIAYQVLTDWQACRTEGAIWGWISTVAYNAAIDVQRRHAKHESVDADREDDASEPARLFAPIRSGSNPAGVYEQRHEVSDCIRRVFAALDREGPARTGSTRTIEILRFTVLISDDVDDLAKHLQCGRHAAIQRRSYALQKLRELCARFCGEAFCGFHRRPA